MVETQNRWKSLARSFLGLMVALAGVSAQAQTCGPPPTFVTGPTNGIVNNYYAGSGNLPVGATSVTLPAPDGRGASTPLAVGDLLLVIQMQDASFNSANNSTYGDGSGSGQGATSIGRSGLYEFVRVTAVAGGNVSFTPPLANSYANADASAGTPQRRFQIVRVMQYTSLAANGITAPAWNGSTGGVAAVDVRDGLVLGGGTVEGQTNRAFFVAGKGFRGGAGLNSANNGGKNNDFATVANFHGVKGEGIAGAPIYPAVLTSPWGFRDTNAPAWQAVAAQGLGYPGGSAAQGAPGNAGGGGSDGSAETTSGNNQYNAGGGGGGNYGPGGIGGRPWNFPLVDSGGRGGAGYAGTLAFNRVFLGGGGGAGGSNNNSSENIVYSNQALACTAGALCSSGAPGGGIVIIRARSISGGGIIDARGGHGYNVGNDAAGGGGAGGSVILQTQQGGSATIYANGGDGGNAWGQGGAAAGNRHGPGGGGGGGFVAYSPSSMAVVAQVNGGLPGKSTQLNPEDYYDANGYNGGLTTFQPPNVPGVPPAAECDPNLSLAKSNGVSSLSSPATTTYSFTVSNAGTGATVGTITVADQLPAGLTVVPGPLALTGANAASWSCTASSTTAIVCTSASTLSGGGSSTFAIPVALSAANGSSIVNRARVTGGNDPAKPTPADPVAGAAACTANNTPAGCALDTDTVLAPNLALTKTDDTDTVVRGGTTTYTLVVTNTGGAPTSGTITVVDVLPTGLSYSGLAVAGGFSCSFAAPNITCTRASALPANTSTTLALRVLVAADAPSSVLNLARVGGGGDPSAAKATPTPATAAACAAPVAPATTSSDPNTGCAADVNGVAYVSLTLSKDDGSPYMSRNGTVEYPFVVRNIGTAATTGTINFRDVLPSTMTFPNPLVKTGTNEADWACTRTSATNVACTSNVSIPAGGSSTFSLLVNVGNVAATTQLTNKARVGGGGDVSTGSVAAPAVADVNACTTDGNPAGCAIDMNTVQEAPRIRLTKSHPDPQPRNPGDTFAFTLVVSNTGGSTATVGTVQVIDVVPAGLTINATPTPVGMTCARSGQVINCRNATSATGTAGTTATYNLGPGATRVITVSVTVDATATNPLINEAKAAGSTDPQNSTPMTTSTANLDIVRACAATDSPTLGCAVDLVPLNADLQVTKLQRIGTGAFAATLPSTVPVGTTVQYQIDVTNAGPARVTGLAIADTVPVNFGTVSWSCAITTQGSGGAPASSCGTVTAGTGNEIALTAGLLRSGAVLRLTVNATAAAGTGIDGVTNTVALTVPAGIVDANLDNNSASAVTRIGSVNLGVTKTNATSSVVSGGTTSYTIVVTNTGTYPADGSRVFDPAATGLACTAPPTCVANGAGTSCPPGLTVEQLQNATSPTGVAIPSLAPGGTLTFTYSCNVTATGL